MGGREKKRREGGRCAPAATAAAVGHAWRAGRGRWGTRCSGAERKKERGKGGAGFAAANHDASRLMGKDGMRIEFGCRVRSPGIGRSEQEGFREIRVRV